VSFQQIFVGPRSAFPFTWYVCGLLDKLHRTSDAGSLGTLEAAFSSTDVGQLVNRAVDSVDQALSLVTEDLLRIKVPGKVDQTLLQLMTKQVLDAAKRASDETDEFASAPGEEGDVPQVSKASLSVVDAYRAVVALRPRLQLCLAVYELVPGLDDKLTPGVSQDCFNLDIVALTSAFDLLEPKGSDMLDTTARQVWSSKVVALSTYAKQLEGLLSDEGDVAALVDAFKKKNLRLAIVKLFLDHTLHADVDVKARTTVCANLRLVLSSLKNPDFNVGSQTFVNLKKAMDSCCRKVGDAFLTTSKGIQECIVCLETIKVPVILPCGHVGCKTCLEEEFAFGGTKACPNCQCLVPDDFQLHSEVRVEEAVAEHAKFRKKLTQFFVETLQRFVFAEERMPHLDIINELLSFIVTEKLPKDEKNPRTKQLSPFPGDFIDARPVVRSFVLQLLLKYDINKVEPHLQEFLDRNRLAIVQSSSQFADLLLMIAKCLENSFAVNGGREVAVCRGHMVARIAEKFNPNANLIRSLVNNAQDRLAISCVAEVINRILTEDGEANTRSQGLLDVAVRFCDLHPDSENTKKYLVRCIAAKFTQNAVVEWKKKNIWSSLLPEDLRNSTDNDTPDMFLTFEQDYKRVRDATSLAWLSGNYEDLTKLATAHQESISWALALHTLTKVNPCLLRDQAAFAAFLDGQTSLKTVWERTPASYPCLTNKSHRHLAVNGLAVHLEAVLQLVGRTLSLVSVFGQLALNPGACAQLYLPTMPQDETLEARAAVQERVAWYTCPNGHAYAIGECLRPMEQGACPTCRAPVGGANHAFVAGAEGLANLMDTTQPGHVLGPAVADVRSVTVREIDGLSVSVIRFLVHLAMMNGAETMPQEVARIVTPTPVDVGEFLSAHLLLNLRQIADCLGRSENDAIVLLHSIISSFGHGGGNAAGGQWLLTQKNVTREWEKTFSEQFIRPVLAQLDAEVARHHLAVKEDKEQASSILQDIIFEPARTSEDRSKVLSLPQFWQPREEIVVERIEAKIGGSAKFKQNCPVLFHLLQEELVLKELFHLPKLLEFARYMTSNFNRKLETVEMDKINVKTFLLKHVPAGDEAYLKPMVKTFFDVFQRLQLKLFAHGQ
jgi:hypothetical protein